MYKYTFDKNMFRYSVTGTGVFCILIGLYSIGMLVMGNALFWVPLIVCVYQVINTFVSISNPAEITISPETLTFSAYGKTHSYPMSEIESLQVKELDLHKKMYVRLNEPTFTRGRYWVMCGKMNDSKQLWDQMIYLEYSKDPNQLKFRARVPVNPYKAEEVQETTELSENTNTTSDE
ncbi:MAG: hypothetical protein RSF82_07725 [Angelakisella sp.]